MATISENLNKVLQAKDNIKQAIIDKGVDLTDVPFEQYASKIGEIQGGGDEESLIELEYPISGGLFTNSVLDMSKVDVSMITDVNNLFYYYLGKEIKNLNLLDTSNFTSMSSMFSGCSKLESLDLSNFDTSNVTSMHYIFNSCSSLTSLNLSSWDTSNVTSMYYMFNNCSSLTSLNLSSWDTSNVTSITRMFANCINLTSLDLSNFDTSNVTSINMGSMFYGCNKLTHIKCKQAFKDWCLSNASTIKLDTTPMKEGGTGVWEIVLEETDTQSDEPSSAKYIIPE